MIVLTGVFIYVLMYEFPHHKNISKLQIQKVINNNNENKVNNINKENAVISAPYAVKKIHFFGKLYQTILFCLSDENLF